MIKKRMALFIAILTTSSLILTSCSGKKKNIDDKIIGDEDSKIEEPIEKEKFIKFKRVFDDIDDSDYDYVYRDKIMNGERIIFTSNGLDIDLLEIVSLVYEDDLEEKEIIERIENIKEGEKVLFDIVIPEGIPSLKIKWYAGDIEDEYIFQYNGREEVEETTIDYD